MRVSHSVTCLVDTVWPDVGVSSVQVLRRAGCEVTFDARQTCCGQPAFSTGFLDEARRVAAVMVDAVSGDDAGALVVPSGSCAAMVKHAPELFHEDDPRHGAARAVAARTNDPSAFLVDVLGVTDVNAHFDGRLVWHGACRGLRELGIARQPRVPPTAERAFDEATFVERARAEGVDVTQFAEGGDVAGAVMDVLRSIDVRRVAVSDHEVARRALAGCEGELVEPDSPRDALLACDAGLTTAQLGIAETGTLVLHSIAERHRLTSLVPVAHVALLRRDTIVPTLDDALIATPTCRAVRR